MQAVYCTIHFLFVQLKAMAQIPTEQEQIACKLVIICKRGQDAAGGEIVFVRTCLKKKNKKKVCTSFQVSVFPAWNLYTNNVHKLNHVM